MATYTTRALVKQQLRIPAAVTTHDGLIDAIVAGIDHDAHGYCGVTGLTSATYTEVLSVDYTTTDILLANRPVTNVAALTMDSALVAAANYVVHGREGVIRLKTGTVSQAAGGVQVTYTAGVTGNDETALQRAMTAWAASRFNRAPHAGFQSEALSGSYKYELAGGNNMYADMPPETRACLDRFCSVFS